MKLTFEKNGKINEENVEEFDVVQLRLGKLHPVKLPYVILENDSGYIQVAGGVDRLTIELRDQSENSFKHYVIGKKPIEAIWCIIQTKVGNIRVMQNELLQEKDASDLFSLFFKGSDLPDSFNKRNVTKLFK